uniref:Uncharacterized protein n=1 Tax=Rhizophora mucronata TaxID=61149 RepID=A0A2P2R2L7_RHIMU
MSVVNKQRVTKKQLHRCAKPRLTLNVTSLNF